MGWFGKKKDDFVDLGESYRRQKAKVSREEKEEKQEDAAATGFGFLGSLAQSAGLSKTREEDSEFDGGSEEKKKKLAKRLIDMTNKIEELNNQIYHLQQRIEVLERKAGVGGF